MQEQATQLKTVKKMMPVIEGQFIRRERSCSNRRVVTIKYKYDRVNRVLTYGATIWRAPTNSRDKHDGPGHLSTAEKRHKTHPVTLCDFEDEKDRKLFHDKVRKQLFVHGCRTPQEEGNNNNNVPRKDYAESVC